LPAGSAGFAIIVFWVLASTASAALHAALNWGDADRADRRFRRGVGADGRRLPLCLSVRARGRLPTHLNPRLSIAETFRSRTVVMFMLFWFVGNILIAVGIPLIGDAGQPIAWDAHIGGFIFGFLLFSLFDRPLPEVPDISDKSDILQS
jgi:hypothetical protein